MIGAFVSMAASPPDPDGAADFAEAIAGHAPKSIAADAGVGPSMVTKWTQAGNVPRGRLALLPLPVQQRYVTRWARRVGVPVLSRETLDEVLALFGVRPVPVKAVLEPKDRGSLPRGTERSVA